MLMVSPQRGSQVQPNMAMQMNAGHPLAQGLARCYLLNDGAGGFPFELGNRGDYGYGATTNGPTWTNMNYNGSAGLGLRFASASSQSMDCHAAFNPTAISLVAWVNPTSFPNTYNSVLSRSDGIATYSQMLVTSGGKLAMYCYGSISTSYDGTGAATLSANTSYQLVLTYDAANGL